MIEQWTEVRCPACRPLNFVDSNGWTREPRLLLFIIGNTTPQDVQIKVKCDRCKSWIIWHYGTPLVEVFQYGKPRIIKSKHAVFE